MAEITMKRIDGAMVTPKDDACLYERAIGKSGIMYGTDISYLGANQVHINAGKGIYKGRDFDIAEQTINVQMSTSGKMAGRIYIHIDLSNTEKPIDILSIAAKALPGLIENDSFNEKLGIGEMELATYTAGEVAITDLRETFAYIGTPYKEIEQQVTGLRENVEQINSNLIPTGGTGSMNMADMVQAIYDYINPDGAVQTGVQSVTVQTLTAVTITVTYPKQFNSIPNFGIFYTGLAESNQIVIKNMSVSTNKATITFFNGNDVKVQSFQVKWVATTINS